MQTISIYYMVAIWFFILGVSNREYLPSSAILSLASSLNVIGVDFYGFVDGMTYLQSKEVLIKFDGAIALALSMIMTIDKHAKKQAVILSFAVICHSMISWYYITESSLVEAYTFLFFQYYDELIIFSALLQMWVTKNGLYIGLCRFFYKIQTLLHRSVFYIRNRTKYLLTRTEREGQK
jgi:hypothetical protein